MLEHHGVVALPGRPYAPDLKGKVESAGGRFAGHCFTSMVAHLITLNGAFFRNRFEASDGQVERDRAIHRRRGVLPGCTAPRWALHGIGSAGAARVHVDAAPHFQSNSHIRNTCPAKGSTSGRSMVMSRV